MSLKLGSRTPVPREREGERREHRAQLGIEDVGLSGELRPASHSVIQQTFIEYCVHD